MSKSQVPEYADKIDVLLLGPHFSAEVPKYKEMLKDHNVKVTSIDRTTMLHWMAKPFWSRPSSFMKKVEMGGKTMMEKIQA